VTTVRGRHAVGMRFRGAEANIGDRKQWSAIPRRLAAMPAAPNRPSTATPQPPAPALAQHPAPPASRKSPRPTGGTMPRARDGDGEARRGDQQRTAKRPSSTRKAAEA